MQYADYTRNDPNPVKRFLQRAALRNAMRPLRRLPDDFAGRILDVGGGDGELCRLLSERFPRAELVCYEPAEAIRAEAARNLSSTSNVELVEALPAATAGARFDFQFCLEVFEHLPDAQAGGLLDEMRSLAADSGAVIIGVPNELYLPAVARGLLRMCRRYGEFDATVANVLRAAIGRPPRDRPLGEVAPGLPYHFHHMGFDYRRLKRQLEAHFDLSETYTSPLADAPLGLGFEVFFVCRARSKGVSNAGAERSGKYEWHSRRRTA